MQVTFGQSERFAIAFISAEKSYTLINTTPHPVHILDRDGELVLTIPAAPQPLRLEEQVEPWGDLAGIPLVRKSLAASAIFGEPREGVFYIVPLAMAQVYRRPDLLVPDDLVRDEQGRVIGCRRFAVVV